MRIDAHQHYWRYAQEGYEWMGERNILKQDYLPAHSLPYLRENGLAGTVAIQARRTLEENDFLIELSKTNDFVKGVVGWVNLCAANVSDVIAQYQEDLCGIRHLIHDETDIDFMLQAEFTNGISQLESSGLTYDLLIRTQHLENATKLIDQFPHQPFVIDHIAKPFISREIPDNTWSTGMRALAERENVYCKLSGMVTEADYNEWGDDEIPLELFLPYMDLVLENFTPARTMFGSDWPVCTLAATYDEVYDIVNERLVTLSKDEQSDIMGDTATRFYGLS